MILRVTEVADLPRFAEAPKARGKKRVNLPSQNP